MRKIGKYVFLLILFWLQVAQANEVKVFATVDRNGMALGDTFTYQITVSSENSVNAGSPHMPDMSDFDLINSWTSSESRSTFTNGTFQVQQSRIYNYMFSPNKAGRLSIGAATIEVDGKSYRTKPIALNVSESAPSQRQARPNQPRNQLQDMEDIFSQLLERRGYPGFRTQPVNPNEAFFIQVEVDKKKVYEGEQITASWYLYTRGQIRDIDTLKYPSLNGFWKEEIELATRLNFQQEIVNGVAYNKALLASFALFPIKPGRATIDSYKAKCTVLSPSSFGFGRPFQSTKASKPIKIEVVPLPTEGRPTDFSGAVGNFRVSASIDKSEVKVNEPITVKIRFEGQGNAKLIDLPFLSLPGSLEIYDTKKESKFFKSGQSFKEFELLMIPREPGDVTIPEISVSLFNPETGKFYQQKIEPMSFRILPGEGQSVIPSAPLAQRGKKTEAQDGPLMPGLVLEYKAGATKGFFQSSWLWVLAYLLVFAFLGWRAFAEFGFGKDRKDLEKILQRRMVNVHKNLNNNDWRGVGVDGTNCLYTVLGEISGEGGASQELEKLLSKSPPSLRRQLADPLRKLLGYFETLSFAPEDVVGSLKEKSKMKEQVGLLEKVLNQAIAIAVKNPLEADKAKGILKADA